MSKLTRILCLGFALLVAGTAMAKSPFSLVKFKRSKSVAQSSRLLTEDNGPWMIFVGSFAGEGAEAEARQLVEKLRSDFRLSAYLHKEYYDFTDPVQGKGFDRYGRPKRMRFASDDAFEEVAVLVGDYETVDDPKLQKHLQQIKYATADELSLKGKASPTTRRFAELREFHKKLVGTPEKRKKGPMGSAFATRNPMLRREMFAPQGLDPLLVEMNEGRDYSLLNNPGQYTVQVASYRGHVVIDQRKVQEIQKNPKKLKSRLDEAGEKAEELTDILRRKGIEAYTFHDRHESIVTVGSFDEVGTPRSDGKTELHPAVAEIIETYGPSKEPIQAGGSGITGIRPKALGQGAYPFDIAPRPIVVPRRSIATDYLPMRR